MKDLLSPEYETEFVDTKIYPPTTPFMLRGLGAAIESTDPTWKPTVSELAEILKSTNRRDRIVAAGSAYGAARTIPSSLPGPVLLLYGAAVEALFQAGDTALDAVVEAAARKLDEADLSADEDVAALLDAGRERARMGRASETMRFHFARGLVMTGDYREAVAEGFAARIVSTTHRVRHRALVDRYVYIDVEPVAGHYHVDLYDEIEKKGSADPFIEKPPKPTMRAGRSLFSELVPHAQRACEQLLAESVALAASDNDDA